MARHPDPNEKWGVSKTDVVRVRKVLLSWRGRCDVTRTRVRMPNWFTMRDMGAGRYFRNGVDLVREVGQGPSKDFRRWAPPCGGWVERDGAWGGLIRVEVDVGLERGYGVDPVREVGQGSEQRLPTMGITVRWMGGEKWRQRMLEEVEVVTFDSNAGMRSIWYAMWDKGPSRDFRRRASP
jgi:hypothetical protein